MRFDKDINSELSDLFLEVRDYLLNNIPSVYEDCRENQTSYKTSIGMYCCIKVKDNFLNITWGRGSSIKDKYNNLLGKGSVVRQQHIVKLDVLTKEIIKYYIDETTIILFENNELKNMRKKLY